MKALLFICFTSIAVMAAENEKQLEGLLKDGNTQFTAKMLAEVAKNKQDQSFVLSAFSVLTPLAQLGLASVGESHDELLAAIGMPNDNITKEAFSLLNTRIRSIKGVTLKTASKIYVANGYELNSDFAALSKDVFDSEVQNVDFVDNERTAKEVNTWVEQQTNDRIHDLVEADKLDQDTRALLVNAIYFKGFWEEQFEKHFTHETDFHVNKNKVVKVPMMYRKGDYKYYESAELHSQILQIPYKGGETSLVIVLPRDIEGIKEVTKSLTTNPQVLDDLLGKMYSTDVEVYIPKFKIETTTDLKTILSGMNINKMFDAQTARLDNLLKKSGGLFVSDATQKAFIEVNEEGAEAAAANGFNFALTSHIIDENPPPVFNADRPFYFVIKSKSLSIFNGIMYGL